MTDGVRLGLRANARQFALLVALNGVVGALAGLERSVLPLVGDAEFGVDSTAAVLSFVAAFGLAKACANLAAGRLADEVGRRRLLLAGWVLALPVGPLLAVAPGWWLVVGANVLLGAAQGLAWSMTVVMKIDLAGPARRGLALGLNESFGYGGVALAAFLTGALGASFAPLTVVWVGALGLSTVGLVTTSAFVRDTADHVEHEHREAQPPRRSDAIVRSCEQAGFVNNLNDALAWGLTPLYLAAHGATVGEIGFVAGLYPAVWGVGQLGTGWLSDVVGRKPLIVTGMLVQAGSLGVLAGGNGAFDTAITASFGLGLGTALVYPTLIAAVSDSVPPRRRAGAVGRYRFWRDLGLVAGALGVGLAADSFGDGAAIVVVAMLTAGSGVVVAATPWSRDRALSPRAMAHITNLAWIDVTSRRSVLGTKKRHERRPEMTAQIGLDVDLLRSEIKKTYASVSTSPEREFVFPTGRRWAEDLDYPPELARVPDSAVESFAGVANPFSLGRLEEGERVLDLGSGAGTDSLVAGRMVGPTGSVVGIDMTPEMLARARAAAVEAGATNVTFVEGEAERLPFDDESFDVVISNGVIDLVPDKDAVFGELYRVLAPGGRLQVADVTIQRPVSEEGRRNIDLWTG